MTEQEAEAVAKVFGGQIERAATGPCQVIIERKLSGSGYLIIASHAVTLYRDRQDADDGAPPLASISL